MRYIIMLVSVLCVAVFAWAGMKNRKKKLQEDKKKTKPPFRTEETLPEYGKPMEPPAVDFDDAE